MKVRLRSRSIRFRITDEERDRLASGETLRIDAGLPDARGNDAGLTFTLAVSDATCVSVRDRNVQATLSEQDMQRLRGPGVDGVYHSGGDGDDAYRYFVEIDRRPEAPRP